VRENLRSKISFRKRVSKTRRDCAGSTIRRTCHAWKSSGKLKLSPRRMLGRVCQTQATSFLAEISCANGRFLYSSSEGSNEVFRWEHAARRSRRVLRIQRTNVLSRKEIANRSRTFENVVREFQDAGSSCCNSIGRAQIEAGPRGFEAHFESISKSRGKKRLRRVPLRRDARAPLSRPQRSAHLR